MVRPVEIDICARVLERRDTCIPGGAADYALVAWQNREAERLQAWERQLNIRIHRMPELLQDASFSCLVIGKHHPRYIGMHLTAAIKAANWKRRFAVSDKMQTMLVPE